MCALQIGCTLRPAKQPGRRRGTAREGDACWLWPYIFLTVTVSAAVGHGVLSRLYTFIRLLVIPVWEQLLRCKRIPSCNAGPFCRIFWCRPCPLGSQHALLVFGGGARTHLVGC